jgi:hypothetical protein
LGAAFVALLLLSGDLGSQASAVTDSRPGQSPLELNGLGYQLSATSESRAGQAPVVPGSVPRAFVAEILTPLVGLELRRLDFDLQLFYSLRLYWEDPNALGKNPASPLILHSVGIALDTQLSHQVILTGSATGSLGSPDYTALPQVLGTGQGSLPEVASIASVSAQARVRYLASRRWELEMNALASHYQWELSKELLDQIRTMPTGQPLITSQTVIDGQPEATFILTPRDSLGLAAAVEEAIYGTTLGAGASVLTVTPTATWKSRLTRRDTLRLTLGVAYGRSLDVPAGTPNPLGPSGSGESPVGSVELLSRVAHHEDVTVQSRVAAGVDYYIDPVLGTALPRATAGAGLTVVSIPGWMVELRGDFGTVLRDPPPIVVAATQTTPPRPPDETVFSVSLNGRRRISENLFGEVGILWADRGPVLSTPDFQFYQRQLWVHVSVTGTTKPIPRQVQPQ